MASVTGAITGYPTYTFNAAGLNHKTMDRYGITSNDTQHIQAYYGNHDPLNKIQDMGISPSAVGNRIRVRTNDGLL